MLTGCAHAQAAPPRTQPVAATRDAAPRTCGEPVAPGPTAVDVAIDGDSRRVRLYLPRDYRSDQPLPLVLNLHGSGSTGARQAAYTGMDATADAHAFLVAYPEGLRRSGSGYAWNIPGTPSWQARGPNEAGFLSRLIRLLHTRFCADLNRVYAVGFSGGARMVSEFACTSDRGLAAVAAVGGLRAPTTCPSAPVPVLAVHGATDRQNPYEGHGQSYWTYGVPEAARRWSAHDGCAPTPVVSRISPGVTLTEYPHCRGGTALQLYTLANRGHVWPAARSGFDTDETLWRFFGAHTRRGADRLPVFG
jgi:polyhydroxybutyrate depolymerase